MPFSPNRSLLLMVERILPLLCPVEGDCSLCEGRGTRQAGSQEVKLLSCVPAWPCPLWKSPQFSLVGSLIFSSLYVNIDFEFIWLFFCKILNCSGDEIS